MNNSKYLHKLHFLTDDAMYKYVKEAKIPQDDIVKMDAQSCTLVFWGFQFIEDKNTVN